MQVKHYNRSARYNTQYSNAKRKLNKDLILAAKTIGYIILTATLYLSLVVIAA